jgi:hypothetical protein
MSLTGIDAVQLDWARIHTVEDDTIQCRFEGYLDDDAREDGKDCFIYHDPNWRHDVKLKSMETESQWT